MCQHSLCLPSLGCADSKDLKKIAQPTIPDDEKEVDRRDVIRMILATMNRHEKVADVQRYACKALENIGGRGDNQRQAIAKALGVQSILKGAKSHAKNPEVQQ